MRRKSDWTRRPRPADEAAEAAYRAALDVATATLAAYDGGTASHSDDVITLCLALAEQLGVEGRDRTYLLAAAELHDIGKVGIPANILRKPGPLDEGEWEAMRQHTVTGQRILGAVPELVDVARIVRHCHERWDGEGYPDGLAGEDIPIAARIVFCADAFHAIRGDRPYRRGRSALDAFAEIEEHSGTQFDPEVVVALGTIAERMRTKRHPFKSAMLGGELRSRRLAALLLALAVGGSAFAGSGIFGPGDAGGGSPDRGADDPPASSVGGGFVDGIAGTAEDGRAAGSVRGGARRRDDRVKGTAFRLRGSGPGERRHPGEGGGRAPAPTPGDSGGIRPATGHSGGGDPTAPPRGGAPGEGGSAPPAAAPERGADDGPPVVPDVGLPKLPSLPAPKPPPVPAPSLPALPLPPPPALPEALVPELPDVGVSVSAGTATLRSAPSGSLGWAQPSGSTSWTVPASADRLLRSARSGPSRLLARYRRCQTRFRVFERRTCGRRQAADADSWRLP